MCSIKNEIEMYIGDTKSLNKKLKAAVHDVWYNDEAIKRACRNVYRSMPQRIAVCIKAKRGFVKY